MSQRPSIPPTMDDYYRVKQITEGRRTWYEVHSDWTRIVWMDSRSPVKWRSLKRAQRRADRENGKKRTEAWA